MNYNTWNPVCTHYVLLGRANVVKPFFKQYAYTLNMFINQSIALGFFVKIIGYG